MTDTPHPTETDIRQQIAKICELHGVSEAAYWNIADEAIALISQTVSSEQAKLLERLYARQMTFGGGDMETGLSVIEAVPVSAIEAEQQRLLGRETL